MMRRLYTTVLMVEELRKVRADFGVLQLPDVGVRHVRETLMELMTVSWRTSFANSRSELVMVPPGLVNLNSCQIIRQMTLVPYLFGSIQTPPEPFPEASVKPRSDVAQCTSSAR